MDHMPYFNLHFVKVVSIIKIANKFSIKILDNLDKEYFLPDIYSSYEEANNVLFDLIADIETDKRRWVKVRDLGE